MINPLGSSPVHAFRCNMNNWLNTYINIYSIITYPVLNTFIMCRESYSCTIIIAMANYLRVSKHLPYKLEHI